MLNDALLDNGTYDTKTDTLQLGDGLLHHPKIYHSKLFREWQDNKHVNMVNSLPSASKPNPNVRLQSLSTANARLQLPPLDSSSYRIPPLDSSSYRIRGGRGRTVPKRHEQHPSCWTPTKRTAVCRDGVTRVLHKHPDKPNELRVRRMVKRDGRTVASFVKP
jgi:hypothetical protein